MRSLPEQTPIRIQIVMTVELDCPPGDVEPPDDPPPTGWQPIPNSMWGINSFNTVINSDNQVEHYILWVRALERRAGAHLSSVDDTDDETGEA